MINARFGGVAVTQAYVVLSLMTACEASNEPRIEPAAARFCPTDLPCLPMDSAVVILDGRMDVDFQELRAIDTTQIASIEILNPGLAQKRFDWTHDRWAVIIVTVEGAPSDSV